MGPPWGNVGCSSSFSCGEKGVGSYNTCIITRDSYGVGSGADLDTDSGITITAGIIVIGDFFPLCILDAHYCVQVTFGIGD